MLVSDFVPKAYLRARGKVGAFTNTSTEWIKLLALANDFKDEWAAEPAVNWSSLYQRAVSAGTVTATDTFNIPTTLNSISGQEGDFIRIVYTDPTKWSDWNLIAPERLKYYKEGNYVAQVGSTLVFNKVFSTTSPEFGGTIQVPGYTIPADLVNDTDVLPVDDPNWLVVRCAAEYIRTDLVYQNQYPNLITESNELMKKMIENNNPQVVRATLERVALGRTW